MLSFSRDSLLIFHVCKFPQNSACFKRVELVLTVLFKDLT